MTTDAPKVATCYHSQELRRQDQGIVQASWLVLYVLSFVHQ
jgi:hypothetical protein